MKETHFNKEKELQLLIEKIQKLITGLDINKVNSSNFKERKILENNGLTLNTIIEEEKDNDIMENILSLASKEYKNNPT